METSQVSKPQRPTFLTVLCVLTFIWSGLNIMSNFFNMIFSRMICSKDLSFLDGVLETIDEEFPRQLAQDAFQMLERAIQHGFAMAITNLLLYGLNLFAAILMFNLNRIGFYLYIVVQVLLLLVSPFFLGWNIFMALGVLFGGFFAVLFIILYGLNLKHMK